MNLATAAVEPQPSPRKLIFLSSRVETRDFGELATVLEPALREHAGTWLGWSGQVRPALSRVAVDASQRPARATFDMQAALCTGFCNRTLWPLFHGLRNRIRFDDAEWEAYQRANDIYARHALQVADLDATIWVHDYELLLVGQGLRRLGHRGPIGHFLHVPFPTRELFETLPWGRELIEGMLAFDLLGFHTEQWAENFVAAARILRRTSYEGGRFHYRDRTTRIGVFPCAVQTTAVDPAALDPGIGLDDQLRDRRIMLGVDPIDHAKGIPERLDAFRCLLERYPEWRRRVVLVQIATPARRELDDTELRARIERQVGEINGSFGEADWTPVCYLYRAYARETLAKLYRLADVAIVTPLRDGMNLIAKEFVAAQHESRPGVLVLSRFAGAAEQMTSALLTNPYHREGLAADLHRALGMPHEERIQRLRSLVRVVHANGTPTAWSTEYLRVLRAHAQKSVSPSSK